MKQRCLIAGCGYTGLRLAALLLPHWSVAALARTEAAGTRLASLGIEPVPADLDAPAAPDLLTGAAEGSAIAYLVPPPEGSLGDPRLEHFLAAVGTAQPTALLYMSTTGAYGDTRGAPVSESSPVAPSSDRARRRVAAEDAVRRWCEERGVRWVVLRVPGIYGPHRLPLERLQRGEPVLRPEDAGPGNRIHVDDLAGACVAALTHPVSGVFNVTDGNPASTTEFVQRTAALAGLPPPPLVALADAGGRISPGMLAFLVESRRVENRRMREELAFVPRYVRLDDGIAASLAAMRAASG